MTRFASPFFQNHEFDKFLLAPIGKEKNGMLLSVLSALARQGLDPWQEAARLSRLPKGAATENLCTMIAALPAGTPDRANPQCIAVRLIALLPVGGDVGRSSQKAAGGGVPATQTSALKSIIAMALIVGLLSLVANVLQSAHRGALPDFSGAVRSQGLAR